MVDDKIFQNIINDGDISAVLGITDDEISAIDVENMPEEFPVLALTNSILYPGMVIPITIGRSKSVAAINYAENNEGWIVILTQKDRNVEDPKSDDLYHIGTIAKILKKLKMPDGTYTAIIQGKYRFLLHEFTSLKPFLKGKGNILPDILPEKDLEFNALIESIKERARKIIEMSPQIPNEAIIMIENVKSNIFLLNFLASNLNIPINEKQEILEINDIKDRGRKILHLIESELKMLEVKGKIESKVRKDLEKTQRDYFLNQQLKTIQEELGQNPQQDELNNLEKKAKKKKWPKEVATKFKKELDKLKRMQPHMPDYSVTLNYLELLLDLPWNEYTNDNFDLKKVKKILDEDHYGLEDVKERILEHLAVLKIKGDMKSPILCLVGPPGVGKTSLGKSIARALERKFIRMSLGGLHDESEIRGHRKTYIGAMPGRIIQNIRKAKTSNPVYILDEIDKVGNSFRGDPSSALLEVLDPEQNTHFHDNYLEVDYDLSKVLFIATANSLNSIQPALLDRMEIIQISGYSTEEKLEIAKRHLIPKQLKAHGLTKNQISFNKAAIKEIIQKYTRESGVRSLDRQIGKVCRKIAKKVAMGEEYDPKITKETIKELLGPSRFSRDKFTKIYIPGVVIGLAWTRVGGDILFVEASLSKGKGKLTLTGNLGNVMKESATTALSFIKAHAKELGIEEADFDNYDIHIHVPEGAIPKDGPSAGITMLTALVSAFKKQKVKSHLAMTGEITLRGQVLPVGGIKEKVLAAKRHGIKTIIMSKENEKDVKQIKEDYIKGMEFIYVDKMLDVIKYALV
ncbi:MAG TPA: endopeptidase La [Bacteroidetes bacterium]|nr:endopeptidase La [Bacteroidota bacterium]